MLERVLSYRHFVMSAIAGEFRARFARSRLGVLWAALHPLAQALTFALILSEVLGARLPGGNTPAAYPIYLLAGSAAWGLFSEILNRSMNVFIEYSALLKKISFPRLCLPFVVWGGALLNHILLLAATLLVNVALGHIPGTALLAVPLGALLISALAFGLGTFLGIINVFSRDVGQVMSVVLNIWFWLTPIVYPRSIIPERFQFLVDLNPMAPLVAIYQDAILLDVWPHLMKLIAPSVLALAAVALSFIVFRRASPDLVDAL